MLLYVYDNVGARVVLVPMHTSTNLYRYSRTDFRLKNTITQMERALDS